MATVSGQNTENIVRVSSENTENKVKVSNNQARYYSDLAEEYKNQAGSYATAAATSATLAEECVATVRQTATEIESATIAGLGSISTATTNATSSISTSTTAGLGSITTATTTATTGALESISATTISGVGSINDAKTSAINTISGSKTEALSILSATTTADIGSINSAKTDALTTIDGAKTEALSTINTTGTNYINQMNTIKEQSTIASNHSSIWAEGTDTEVQALGGVHSSKGWAIENESKVHALKSYEDAGELLTDSEGLVDVKEYAHSTFDLSKFVVTGSPTITDDGIASGFSQYDYLAVGTGINYDISNHTYTFEGRIIFDNPSNGSSYCFDLFGMKYLIILDHTTNSGGTFTLQMFNASDSFVTAFTTDSFSLSLNNYIDFKLNLSSTKQEIFYSVNGGTVLSKASTVSPQLTTVSNAPFYIGVIGSASWYISTQATDLKYVALEEDGIEVFSGNKTGIDTIKPDNYTVVGTPTISADGVASGFSGSNYLTNSTVILTNSNTIKIQGRFKTANLQNTDASILGIYGWDANFGCNNTALYASFGGASVNSSLTLEANTEYDYILEYNKSSFALSVKKISSSNYTTTTGTASSSFSYSGFTLGNGVGGAFTGSIDLNAFKIYVDGDLVYQPCLKIPYTKSKTGSKIVDSVYRDRVTDMYSQFGYAPYHTLSNSDFTLPMGELYGMYEKYRQQILDDMMPDYASGVSFTGTITLPCDALIYSYNAGDGHWVGCGFNIGSTNFYNSSLYGCSTCTIASKGATVQYAEGTCYYFPLKGVN